MNPEKPRNATPENWRMLSHLVARRCIVSLMVAIAVVIQEDADSEPETKSSFYWCDYLGDEIVVSDLTLTVASVEVDCALEDCKPSDAVLSEVLPVLRKQVGALKRKDSETWLATLVPAPPARERRENVFVVDMTPSYTRKDTFAERAEVFEKAESVRLLSYFRHGLLVIARLELRGTYPESDGRYPFFMAFKVSKPGLVQEELWGKDSLIFGFMGVVDYQLPGKFGGAIPKGSERILIPCPYGATSEYPIVLSYNAPRLGKGVRLTNGLEPASLPALEDASTSKLLLWFQDVWRDAVAIQGASPDLRDGLIDKYAATFLGEEESEVAADIRESPLNFEKFLKEKGTDLWVRYFIDAGRLKVLVCTNGDSRKIWFQQIVSGENGFKIAYSLLPAQVFDMLFIEKYFEEKVWSVVDEGK